jgi:hypothetical protein
MVTMVRILMFQAMYLTVWLEIFMTFYCFRRIARLPFAFRLKQLLGLKCDRTTNMILKINRLH